MVILLLKLNYICAQSNRISCYEGLFYPRHEEVVQIVKSIMTEWINTIRIMQKKFSYEVQIYNRI